MNQIKCDIAETARDFRYWSSVPNLFDSTRVNIAKADIAVVPWERFRDRSEPLFPTGTTALFQFLKSNLPIGTEVELAVEDEDYLEVSLHSDIVRIAAIVVRDGAVPLLLNLLATWIAKQIWPDVPTDSNPEVHASIIVVQTDGARTKSVELHYEGPATTFEATVRAALEKTCVSESMEFQDPVDSKNKS